MLGIVAVILFLRRRRLSGDALAAATMLVPFAFYIVAFFLGQDVMYIPYANHPPYYVFYNARFGAEMAAPVAVFIATLAQSARRWHPDRGVCSGGGSCWPNSRDFMGRRHLAAGRSDQSLSCNVSHAIVAYLAQHYNGGRILIDEYHSQIDLCLQRRSHFATKSMKATGWYGMLRSMTPSAYVGWIDCCAA